MTSKCGNCKRRAYAEKHPNSIRGRLWYWHTRWCPGWRAYQRELRAAEKEGRV